MADRFNSSEELSWSAEAFLRGVEARRSGFAASDPKANPYTRVENGWLDRSFRAGWADEDMAQASEADNVQP